MKADLLEGAASGEGHAQEVGRRSHRVQAQDMQFVENLIDEGFAVNVSDLRKSAG